MKLQKFATFRCNEYPRRTVILDCENMTSKFQHFRIPTLRSALPTRSTARVIVYLLAGMQPATILESANFPYEGKDDLLSHETLISSTRPIRRVDDTLKHECPCLSIASSTTDKQLDFPASMNYKDALKPADWGTEGCLKRSLIFPSWGSCVTDIIRPKIPHDHRVPCHKHDIVTRRTPGFWLL